MDGSAAIVCRSELLPRGTAVKRIHVLAAVTRGEHHRLVPHSAMSLSVQAAGPI